MTPLERAAKALWDRENPTVAWDVVPRWMADACRAQVETVIEAIREPGESVLAAGEHQVNIGTPDGNCVGITYVWDAMIDALLAEGNGK